jgi:hypothetical protein
MTKMLPIVIEAIPAAAQRYDTAGDWFYNSIGELRIFVNEASDPRYSFLIALHELVEVKLCEQAGITQEMVDEFDLNYKGDDPGADSKAPYHVQHNHATAVEKYVAEALGVNWEVYDNWCIYGDKKDA